MLNNWPRRIRVIATISVLCFIIYGSSQARSEDEKTGKVDDYNQWKQALGTNRATDPKSITVPPGFAVELLRSAQANEGSWISLTFDPSGRIIVAREDRGLLRITPPSGTPNGTSPKPDHPGEGIENSVRIETIDDTLLECRGLLWAYDALYVNANNSKAFYRLPFNKERGQFEAPQLLRSTPGHVGHGRNDLVLGPDGYIYLIHGDDVFLPPEFQPERSPLRNYSDDRLLPCAWDDQLFNSYMKLPGGHVVRTDRDGKKWELVAGGLRNPYGLDFNADGELFTFDADMEWDVGMPWYRPTRVLHLVSGADYGWRRGTGTWRAWYPDSLKAVVDVGLGSPTAVKFGTRSNFPADYQQALFILDWAYGRILAVHLAPEGSTYTGTLETFVAGRPLNVTDVEFGPDGAMYFLTGGRKTQSGLYRVRYVGPKASGAPATAANAVKKSELQTAAKSRELRRRLEAFHGHESAEAIDVAWPYLGHEDPVIRHAARVAIEHQPVSKWRERALKENKPVVAETALLALARLGLKSDRDPLLSRLMALPWNSMSSEQRLIFARCMTITLARHEFPDQDDSLQIAKDLDRRFPDPSPEVNQLLCESLVAFKSPKVVSKTLKLIASAKTQEEKFHYLVTLRHVPGPWESGDRRRYVTWLTQADDFYGAQYLPRYLQWLKTDVAAGFSPEEQQMFADALKDQTPAADTEAQIQRPHVRNWQLDDLAGSIDSVPRPTDLERGKETFSAALCIRCHRMGSTGSPLGPDLTAVSRRFGRRDLLLAILAPSHVIDEKYQATTIVTHSGKVVSGQVTGRAADVITVTPNLLYPDSVVRIPVEDIESQTPALTSTMPAGLINTFTKEEILDLLAYIESSGK